MKQDNPIEEIWRIRDELGAQEGFDVHRLFERLRREQKQFADRLIQPPSRPAVPNSALTLHDEPPAEGGKSGGSRR
jgi:hypothetical protein